MGAFLCRLFGHSRFIDCDEFHVRGHEGVFVIVRCHRCKIKLDEYEAPF